MGSKRHGDWKRIVLGAALVALAVLTATGRASAGQETVAGVTGTVTDESQSIVPGVTVTVSCQTVLFATVAPSASNMSPSEVGVWSAKW